MKRLLLLLTCLLPVAAQAQHMLDRADAWREVERTEHSVFSIADGTITGIAPPYRTAWVREVNDNVSEFSAGVRFDEWRMLHVYDCERRRQALLESEFYLSGQLVHHLVSGAHQWPEWKEVREGALVDKMFRAVCERPLGSHGSPPPAPTPPPTPAP